MKECIKAGYGGVIRGSLGSSLTSYAWPLPACSVNEAELFRSQERGARKGEKIGAQGGILEGDSTVVTGWAKDSACPWRVLVKLEFIRLIYIKGILLHTKYP